MRRGSALPLVLIVLLIAASLGATWYFTGRSGYRATAQAAYRLRLQTFMVSAMDEARARIYQLTQPGVDSVVARGNAGLRDMILAAIPTTPHPLQQGVNPWDNPPDLSQVDFEVQLGQFQGNDLLWASRAIAFADQPANPSENMGRVEILEAKARFHGFRYVHYDDPDQTTGNRSFPLPGDYYANVDPFNDGVVIHRDYTGYCTITLRARLTSRRLTLNRKMEITHDIKIADTRPPARDFVLFSYRSTIGHDDRVYRALNEGGSDGGYGENGAYDPNNPPSGRLILYPESVGRVYIRGPYVMLTEGATNGLGGNMPVVGNGFPIGGETGWGGFGQTPPPRGTTMPWKAANVAISDVISPIRPQRPCTNGGSMQVGFPLLSTLGQFGQRDGAGLGVPVPFVAAGTGFNRQRLLLNGEPGCHGLGIGEQCRGDSFEGILKHLGEWNEDGTPKDPDLKVLEVWDPYFPTESATDPNAEIVWPKDKIIDSDQIITESGPPLLGLYGAYKVYPFAPGERCPNSGGVGDWVGRGLRFVASMGTLGAFTFSNYKVGAGESERGFEVAWNEDELKKVAEKPHGLQAGWDFETEMKDLEPFAMLAPYAIHYSEPKTQGWKAGLVNLGLETLLAATMFIPGPGIIANTVMRGGYAARGAAMAAAGGRSAAAGRAFLTMGAGQNAVGRTIGQRIVGSRALDMGTNVPAATFDMWVLNKVNAAFPDALPAPETEDYRPGAAERVDSAAVEELLIARRIYEQELRERYEGIPLEELQGGVTVPGPDDPSEVLEQFEREISTLEGLMKLYKNNGIHEVWDAGAGALDSLMSANPPAAGAAGDEFQQLRARETGLDQATTSVWQQYQQSADESAYIGFMPPGLKPVQRLATQWFPSLNEATDAEGRMHLEGVYAFETFPQEEPRTDRERFDKTLTYTGRGMIVSSAGADPDGPNQRPAFLNGIKPATDQGANQDHMTLMYWTQLDAQQARGKSGVGMVSLSAIDNYATFVTNYGVRPLQKQTSIRGNLVTGFLDRNRFPDSADLRVFYRWDVLRPDKPKAREASDTPYDPTDPDAQLPDNYVLGEDQIRPWMSVSMSPRIAGWYDSVE